jgi:hypothetical protein
MGQLAAQSSAAAAPVTGIAGVVVDSAGRTIRDAQLTVREAGKRGENARKWDARSDSVGRFRIEGIAAGTLRLEVLRDAYEPAGFDLQIAGHTHGGHIRGLDQWIVAPANDGFVRGLYEVGAMRLFVSSGAGLWPGFAVRLGVPSSIDVLVLRRAAP